MPTQLKEEILDSIKEIPSLPSAAMRLIELTENPGADLSEISRIISADQSLAIRVLQVANSPFYGLARKIGSIDQAVVAIGFQSLKNITLSLSVMKVSQKPSKVVTKKIEAYWKHSLATAIAARQLAISLNLKNPDEAFTAGLIHDIGKLVLMSHSEELYSKAIEGLNEGHSTLTQAEHEIYEMDHAELGAELCRHWRLPNEIIEAVDRHHDFNSKSVDEKSLSSLAGLVCVADEIAVIALDDELESDYIDPVFIDLLTKAGYPMSKLTPIIFNIPKSLKEIEVYFGLTASPELSPSPYEHHRVGVYLEDKQKKALVELLLTSFKLKPVEVDSVGEISPQVDDVVLEELGWNDYVFSVRLFKKWVFKELSKPR